MREKHIQGQQDTHHNLNQGWFLKSRSNRRRTKTLKIRYNAYKGEKSMALTVTLLLLKFQKTLRYAF